MLQRTNIPVSYRAVIGLSYFLRVLSPPANPLQFVTADRHRHCWRLACRVAGCCERDNEPPGCNSEVGNFCGTWWAEFIGRRCLTLEGSVVTICTAQRSLYVPLSDHYMYRSVITIYTAQWSLYVPLSDHYIYRSAIIIYTAQWSLYIPLSDHYICRSVVTICTAQLSLHELPV